MERWMLTESEGPMLIFYEAVVCYLLSRLQRTWRSNLAAVSWITEGGWQPQLSKVRIAKVGSATVSKKEHKGCLFSRQMHALGYRPGDDCQGLGRVLRGQGWMRLCGSGNTQIGTSQGAGNRRRGG